ncbi:MAG: Rpn family recombination-promoting nuclease/putative transposase, partial [Desulfonatronovibrio sp.]
MENEIIRRAHDKCFKSFFSREEVVRDYIRFYIPEEIRKHVDLSTLRISMTGFISKELKEYFSDVMVTMDLIGNSNPLSIYFLYEHKSYPDWFARVQMLNYELQKWIDLKVNNQLSSHLPVIIPVLIYNGQDKWKFSTKFEDYFELPSEYFLDFVPKFRHIHHDIGQMDDAAFKTSAVME